MTVSELIEELQKLKTFQMGDVEVFFDEDKMNGKIDHRPIKDVTFAWYDGECRVTV